MTVRRARYLRRLRVLGMCGLMLCLNAACQSNLSYNPGNGGPKVALREAPLLQFRGANSSDPAKPGECDCNNPAHWDGQTLYVFNSAGHPWRSAGRDLFHLTNDYARCEYDNTANGGRWIECTWQANNGVLYGWYHYEPRQVCPASGKPSSTTLTAPQIGAVTSTNNGLTWHDLGLVLEAPPDTLNCQTKNHYFAGGNGDFSVMLDVEQQYLYFFFSTYPSIVTEQGVAVARMRWADRDQPINKVWKYHNAHWNEPGLGGHVTPIFPARTDWHRADADAFWGPSIHWNSHLHMYVMLLNRTKNAEWAQEGIYLTFNRNLREPTRWSSPQKLTLAAKDLAWYPQVVGLDASKHETDKLAGSLARLFIRGASRWEIVFLNSWERQ